MRGLTGVVLVFAAAFVGAESRGQDDDGCRPAAGRAAAGFTGEVAGTERFTQAVGPGWTFVLDPALHGWDIRLYDRAGLDLSQITPPFHAAVPNPRELYGWHVRNRANTGPNTGDVNAPQWQRTFIFSPALTGTGGYRPPRGGPQVSVEPPFEFGDADGRGHLRIVDHTLADTGPGQQARFTSLRFEVCLSWPVPVAPEPAEEESVGNAAAPDVGGTLFLAEEVERLRACGLAADDRPEAWLLPRWQEADFDGDGALDLAAPVLSVRDGSRAIVVCRAGARLDRLDAAGLGLPADYLDRTETWRSGPLDAVPVHFDEAPRPATAGDVLTLERVEKSAYSIYRRGEGYAIHRHYPNPADAVPE